jgi:hypothetical protein
LKKIIQEFARTPVYSIIFYVVLIIAIIVLLIFICVDCTCSYNEKTLKNAIQQKINEEKLKEPKNSNTIAFSVQTIVAERIVRFRSCEFIKDLGPDPDKNLKGFNIIGIPSARNEFYKAIAIVEYMYGNNLMDLDDQLEDKLIFRDGKFRVEKNPEYVLPVFSCYVPLLFAQEVIDKFPDIVRYWDCKSESAVRKYKSERINQRVNQEIASARGFAELNLQNNYVILEVKYVRKSIDVIKFIDKNRVHFHKYTTSATNN